MKIKQTRIGLVGKGLITLVLACGLVLAALPARAVVDCAGLTAGSTDAATGVLGDFDTDGIRNGEECTSILLIDGVTTVPGCPGSSSVGCLDPNKADVFVILNRVATTLIPADPFKLVTQAVTGLDVALHEIASAQADTERIIMKRGDGTFVRAAQISESLAPATTADTKLGTAQQGMLIDKATVYTQRIVDKVNAVCTNEGGSGCADISGLAGQNLIDYYIRHTLAHELGHILSVAPEENSRFAGYHWKAGSGFIMDQSIIYAARRGVVTFYVTGQHDAVSQSSFKAQ